MKIFILLIFILPLHLNAQIEEYKNKLDSKGTYPFDGGFELNPYLIYQVENRFSIKINLDSVRIISDYKFRIDSTLNIKKYELQAIYILNKLSNKKIYAYYDEEALFLLKLIMKDKFVLIKECFERLIIRKRYPEIYQDIINDEYSKPFLDFIFNTTLTIEIVIE